MKRWSIRNNELYYGYLENESATVLEEMSVFPSLERFFVTVNTQKQTIRSTIRATPIPVKN